MSLKGTHYFNILLMSFGKLSVDFSTTAPSWYLRCQFEVVIIAGLLSIDE